MAEDARSRITENPFYILGLPVTASRQEVEREGQKLLAMLDVGLSGAKAYATPLGGQPRTPEKVRQAMAELRDPDRRLVHELWASIPSDFEAPEREQEGRLAPWPDVRAALGWRPR
jgi:hypothetical protein